MAQVARRSVTHAGAAAILVGIVVGACTGGGSAPTVGPTTPASTSAAATAAVTPAATAAAPAPTGPATFQFAATGDPNVTGTWGPSFGIACYNPGYDGLTIYFFAESPDKQAVVLVSLSPGTITVSERAGAGATFTSRDFTGSGPSAFDPTKGATFDSDLTIVPTEVNHGTLGTITHIVGSVDCGGTLPGSSTVSVDGTGSGGPVSGSLDPVKVTCTKSAANGDSVSVIGIIKTGPSPSSVNLALRATGSTVFLIPRAGPLNAFYDIDATGTVTLTATGGHVDAGFTQQMPAGSTTAPLTVHVTGDATCGSTVTN